MRAVQIESLQSSRRAAVVHEHMCGRASSSTYYFIVLVCEVKWSFPVVIWLVLVLQEQSNVVI